MPDYAGAPPQDTPEPYDSSEPRESWERQYKSSGNIWGGIVDLPELPAGTRVLEAGCGNGKTLLAMQGKGLDIFAFDFSRTAAALAKKNLTARMSGEVLIGDASKLMFAADTFDVVFARHIIGHSLKEERCAIVSEFCRVLKRGGVLYFTEFEAADMKACGDAVPEPRTYRKKNGIMTHFFTEDEVRELFCDRGYECVSLHTHRWDLKVRGARYPRAEVNGVFRKK